MKKAYLSVILLTIFAVFLLFSAFPVYGSSYDKILIRDNGNVLSDSLEAKLSEKLARISRDRECDLAVVTVQSLNGRDVQRYAHELYDQNSYGQGSTRDGILLLVSIWDREYAFSFNGFANDKLSNAALDLLEKDVRNRLSEDDYAGAFDKFADDCNYLLGLARNGKSYNPFPWIIIPISLILGFVIAFFSVSSMKRKLNSVRLSGNAASYVRPGSLNLQDCRDLYLYSTVTRVPKPRDNGGSGKSSGGSRSVGSRGGRSGRF